MKESLLVVIFAVHVCNAPEPVYNWLDAIEKVNHFPAVVISVLEDGEMVE